MTFLPDGEDSLEKKKGRGTFYPLYIFFPKLCCDSRTSRKEEHCSLSVSIKPTAGTSHPDKGMDSRRKPFEMVWGFEGEEMRECHEYGETCKPLEAHRQK